MIRMTRYWCRYRISWKSNCQYRSLKHELSMPSTKRSRNWRRLRREQCKKWQIRTPQMRVKKHVSKPLSINSITILISLIVSALQRWPNMLTKCSSQTSKLRPLVNRENRLIFRGRRRTRLLDLISVQLLYCNQEAVCHQIYWIMKIAIRCHLEILIANNFLYLLKKSSNKIPTIRIGLTKKNWGKKK